MSTFRDQFIPFIQQFFFISCHNMELFPETQIIFFAFSLVWSTSSNYRPLNFKILFLFFVSQIKEDSLDLFLCCLYLKEVQ